MSRSGADGRLRIAAWITVAAIAAVPVLAAAASPLQRGREFLWITGGMAGVLAMSLLFLQPLLVAASPPLLAARSGFRWHRWGGMAIVAMVLVHVGALYAFSPDDVTDALLLRAPTPFSVYGVIGLGCLGLTALLAAVRRRVRLGFWTWRLVHSTLAVVVVGASAIHALQIDGAMEDYSKMAICVAALAAAAGGALQVSVLLPLRRRRMLRDA